MFTLSNLEIFNFENVKNKEYVHTWAKVTGYASSYYTIDGIDSHFFSIFKEKLLALGANLSKENQPK